MTTRQLGVVQQQVGRSTGKATGLLEVTRDQDEVCYIDKDVPVTQLQDRVEIDTTEALAVAIGPSMGRAFSNCVLLRYPLKAVIGCEQHGLAAWMGQLSTVSSSWASVQR